MTKKIFTNCFLIKNDDNGYPTQVCLAMKKRGFGAGLWNGAGGKPKDGESIEKVAKLKVEKKGSFCAKINYILSG